MVINVPDWLKTRYQQQFMNPAHKKRQASAFGSTTKSTVDCQPGKLVSSNYAQHCKVFDNTKQIVPKHEIIELNQWQGVHKTVQVSARMHTWVTATFTTLSFSFNSCKVLRVGWPACFCLPTNPLVCPSASQSSRSMREAPSYVLQCVQLNNPTSRLGSVPDSILALVSCSIAADHSAKHFEAHPLKFDHEGTFDITEKAL